MVRKNFWASEIFWCRLSPPCYSLRKSVDYNRGGGVVVPKISEAQFFFLTILVFFSKTPKKFPIKKSLCSEFYLMGDLN